MKLAIILAITSVGAQAALTTSANCSVGPNSDAQSGDALAQCSAFFQDLPNDTSIEETVKSMADYVSLQIEAATLGHSFPPNPFPGVDVSSTGGASFSDTLTLFSVPAGARLQAEVFGYVYDLDHNANGTIQVGAQNRQYFQSDFISERFDVAFTPGVPVSLAGDLDWSAFWNSIAGIHAPPNNNINLSLTLNLIDANDQLLSNFTFNTASGARFGLAGTFVVPEPGSLVLVCVGLGGLAILRRRSKVERG